MTPAPEASTRDEAGCNKVISPAALAEDATVVICPPEAPTAEDAATASTAPVEDAAMAPSEGTTMVCLVARTPAPETAAPPPWSGLSNLCCQAPTRKDVPTTSTAPAEDVGTIAAAAPRTRRRAHDLLPNWLPEPDTPAGIGNLTALHTFGVVNVGKGSAVVKELKWLTQLRRLGVSGINPDNIHECLLVRIDKNKRGSLASLDSTLSSPPKTLIKLKLQGHLCIRPGSWIKKLAVQVKRVILEVTGQTQQDMQVIIDEFKHDDVRYVSRLCIKPIHDGELLIGIARAGILSFKVLEIVCTSDMHVTIGNCVSASILRVQCSSQSSLKLSGLQEIGRLNEVWLKGSYSDALKQDLQRQHRQCRYNKPVLKVLEPRLS
ncbi:unnamed protein product [Urochloa humidicola]